MKTNKKAISLIVLIITIIIMALLTAIIILNITSSDIINYGKSSVEKFKDSEEIANMELLFADFYMSAIINNVKDGAYEIKKSKSGAWTVADIEIPISEEVKLGWVYIEGHKITNYEFFYNDYYVLKANDELTVKEFDLTTLINVTEAYGAIPNDNLDDTLAIRNAITALNSTGGTLYFPTGIYNVSVSVKDTTQRKQREKIIALESSKDVNIDFFGSTLKLAAHEYPYAYMVDLYNCSSAEVRNGFLVGDRINHDYTAEENGTEGMNHYGGYGIIVSNTDSASVYNMNVSQMTGDGIVTGCESNEPTGKTVINQCNVSYCRRLGIQVYGGDVVYIYNTKIHHIGDFDKIKGIAPKSGIDLEPYNTPRINTVEVKNCNISYISSEYNTSAVAAGIIKSNNVEVSNFKILNSDIDNLQVDNGEVYNSKLNYNGLTTLRSLEYMKIYESYINLINYKGGTLWLKECEIIDSKFEGVPSKSPTEQGCAVEFISTTVENTIFYNFWGIPVDTNNYLNSSLSRYYGLIMDKNSEMFNCEYENCSIRISSILAASDTGRSKIKRCYLSFDGNTIDANNTITLENVDFEECNTRNIPNGSWTVKFINCSGEYMNFFGTTKKVIE